MAGMAVLDVFESIERIEYAPLAKVKVIITQCNDLMPLNKLITRVLGIKSIPPMQGMSLSRWQVALITASKKRIATLNRAYTKAELNKLRGQGLFASETDYVVKQGA